MKNLKLTLGLSCAIAVMLCASRAHAILSDSLQLLDSGGFQIGFIAAAEGSEQDPVTGLAALFQFDHNYSDPAKLGQYYVIMEGGIISDVVGVARLNGSNVFGFLSDYSPGGLTNADIGQYFTLGDVQGVFTENASGITLDVSYFINQGNPGSAGGTATFISDGDPVPDGGSAVALLGIALAGIEGTRRMIRARKA